MIIYSFVFDVRKASQKKEIFRRGKKITEKKRKYIINKIQIQIKIKPTPLKH